VHTGFGGTPGEMRPLGKPRPAVLIPGDHGLREEPWIRNNWRLF
jgi:hypothetical protein